MSYVLGEKGRRTNLPAASGFFRHREVVLLALSRLAIYAIGVVAALVVADQPHFGLGSTGDVLAAPVLSKDGGWFAGIALHGYDSIPHSTAYLPLYPLLLSVGSAGGLAAVTILGVAISTAAFGGALFLLHRLVRLDFGDDVAMRTVVIVGFFPTAVFFTAVYSESLFLLLTVGAFYAARLDEWPLAGALGALASATRVTGYLLAIALLAVYLYGPRGQDAVMRARRWRPRFPLRPNVLWLALVPAGLGAFCLYTWIEFGDLLAPAHQDFWEFTYHGPLFDVVEGTRWGLDALIDMFDPDRKESVTVLAGHVAGFAFLPLALVALVGTLRREPGAYGVWALLSMVPALTYYDADHPLTSLQRYMVVVFPLYIWLALWASTTIRYRAWLTVSIAGLIGCSALFATGHLS